MKLRAVIEGNVKKHYVDFYGESEKINRAIQDIDNKKSYVKMYIDMVS